MLKLRSGWDEKNINVLDYAKMAEQCGIAALCVHPRTRSQQFKGHSDWSIIKKVKQYVSIPVIGSGDIKTPEDAKQMLTETGCDAIMIGRAAIGNPWIFREVIYFLKTGKHFPPPTFKERVELYLKHTKLLIELKGERTGVLEMRKYGHRYVSGEPGAAGLRQKINSITTYSELEALLLSVIR